MANVTIAQWAAKTQAKLDLLVRKVALEAFAEVILKSPVDTGRFRGNWQVGIGNVPGGVLVLDDVSGTATISKATAVAQNVRAGQVINLVNNLPYALKLEQGSSQQAPGGMVRLAVQRWQPIVDQAVAQIASMP